MKLRVGKQKQPERQPGRQRRQATSWERPAAFSYSSQRDSRPEPGRKQSNLADKRHRMLSIRFWARRSGLLVAVVAVLVCLVSIVSLSNQPRIILLDENDGSYAFHDQAAYQKAASEYLSSSIWNKNKITVNTGAASAELKKRYPELATVQVTLPLIGHRPIYYLTANQPAFVLQTVNGTYVLDQNGKVLITKDAAPEAVVAKLPVITDQTGIRAELGSQAMSAQDALFVQTVVSMLNEKGVTVSSLSLPPNAVQQLDVRVAGQAYIVKFNMHDREAVRQQVGTYLATAKTLADQNTTPAQYIDVRVPGRSYYQ
jgi:hypothetical protein